MLLKLAFFAYFVKDSRKTSSTSTLTARISHVVGQTNGIGHSQLETMLFQESSSLKKEEKYYKEHNPDECIAYGKQSALPLRCYRLLTASLSLPAFGRSRIALRMWPPSSFPHVPFEAVFQNSTACTLTACL